jgi:hypothetical protein
MRSTQSSRAGRGGGSIPENNNPRLGTARHNNRPSERHGTRKAGVNIWSINTVWPKFDDTGNGIYIYWWGSIVKVYHI